MTTSLQLVLTNARETAEAGDFERAWSMMEKHRESLGEDPAFAWGWLVLSNNDPDRSADVQDIDTILDEWWDHPRIVIAGAEQLLARVDGRPADEPIPDDDVTGIAIEALSTCLGDLEETSPDQARDPDIGGQLWDELGRACRLAGPAHDKEAKAAYLRAIEVDPGNPWWRFNLGLLHKNRGNWQEGIELFRKVREMAGDDESVLWNLGICSTGAFDGKTAAEAWNALGLETTIGDDGLPRTDSLGRAKVRLSTGGIGAVHKGSRPVDFEHVWMNRLSPCHGVVLNPTESDVNADYGDAVLHDGASIGEVTWEGRTYSRFPFLARLFRAEVPTFRFLAIQGESGQIAQLSECLSGESGLYVFSEQVEYLCAECIRKGSPRDHEHRPGKKKQFRVQGKLTFEKGDGSVTLASVAESLISSLAEEQDIKLAVPDLFLALGDQEAADDHRALREQLEALGVINGGSNG